MSTITVTVTVTTLSKDGGPGPDPDPDRWKDPGKRTGGANLPSAGDVDLAPSGWLAVLLVLFSWVGFAGM